ncbi:MAG: ActS/PrrB/RegB family redox-sensitive histidine kinase [Alphaproteobacteria bacterium]|nr:ActS/PrrB/RegB family redox-sensitive histidine kinase [Alphaproteobacteria bacterium]
MNAATASTPAEPRTAFDRISLRRLVLIRSVAVTGQALTLLTVHFILGFRLPLLPALAAVGCSVLLNLGSVLFHRAGTRLGERAAGFYLAYDTLQLAVLLYLTGGLENPFSILMLAPVTVAATALSRRPVIVLASLAVAAITVLGLGHEPLPWRTTPFVFPADLVFGIWMSLVLATVFIGGYTWSVAQEARRLRDAVAATQLALAREQRVSAVGALAAAAAHELGSPLATIAVIAKELARELPGDSPHAEDAALLLSQSERCRHILAELAHQPEEDGGLPYTSLPISALVEASGALYRDPRIRLIFATTGEPADNEPLVARSPEILHGLNNLIQNAVQFARHEVSVTIFWDAATVTVEVADDGPGFPPHLLGRLGEPYLSTRAGNQDHMGLGIFIAQSLLERSGATLHFDNLSEGGAHVVISWNRANLETAARAQPHGAGGIRQPVERHLA